MPSRFCADHGIARVHANAEWGLNERRRDEAVAAALGEADVEWTLHQGGTLLPPGSVLTGRASATVYTPYARACREKLRSAPLAAVAAPVRRRRRPGARTAAGPLRRLRPALGRGARSGPPARMPPASGWPALSTRPSSPTRATATSRRDPARVACRPIWPPACCRPARRARRRRRTWASWTAARPASPPGSMNCCGASSTSTCWPPIPNCRCTGP